MKSKLKLIFGGLALMVSGLLAVQLYASAPPDANGNEAIGRKMAKQAIKREKKWSTTNHSNHPVLQEKFTSGEQITEACLSCHSEAAEQFHKTIHWTWLAEDAETGKKYGKAGDSLNNFCLSGNAMEDKGCLKCHTAWNKKGTQGQINCLKCHNTSGFNFDEAFTDINEFSNDGDPETDEIAADIQMELVDAVGRIELPDRKNCGTCHFKGGGGDGVKHGDLDTSLTKPNKELDVHMGIDGENFSCTRCHTTSNHNIAGRIYTNPAVAEKKSLIEDDLAPKITCVSCHSSEPHKNDSKMNDHTDKVSCQACHIPSYARVNPTKMSWDWTKAGDLKDGKPYHTDGPLGKPIYKSIKGEFTWDKNVVPEYFWSDGSLSSTTARDVIDPAQVVKVSHPVGDKDDPDSRIYPFKIHRGKQPYDKVNKTLLAPMLSGPKGYWTTFDMPDAIAHGNKALDIPFSGEFDYVETTYAFPITHMVAPKGRALNCNECHIRENGRIANLAGLYLPGRDRLPLIDNLGFLAVLGALVGVGLHGIGRFFAKNNGKEASNERKENH
ncbi:MAG: tetrathionate reductase family octaheme c-type cytochrome [Desulfobacteraceae bacterium]|nr:MAG: tetrathionate reductase family octaheme c-type cytochrome [Desulfobacteraceae bacterium]